VSPHTIEHLWLLAGVLAFGLVTAWIGWHVAGSSSPIDDAQRELDKKGRRRS
jgi:hypothetical protein